MKSILVIGMGRLGRHLAYKMQQLGNDVMIIDKDEELIEALARDFTDAQIGDCCNEGVLRSIGVNNFDICFVTIGEDFESSLEITATLKELGAKYVVSKANRNRQAEFLKKIGADEVVHAEREVAEKLAVRFNTDNIFDYIPITDEYSIYEIAIPASWMGKSIMELDIRNKHRINILAVKHGEKVSPLPGAQYIFRSDDAIIVMGQSEDVFKLK